VVVDLDGDRLVVEVTNDAVAAPGPANGTGSGLVGLAERVRLFHGTLEAGRRIGGGFRLRALIPLDPAGPS
jgi:signal transduction histidine kinase